MGRTLRCALFAASAVVSMTSAAAQDTAQFEIPPQSLASALQSFGVQSQRQVLFKPSLAQGKRTRGVTGAQSVTAALDLLLAGTGLRYRVTEGGTILIEQAPTPTQPLRRDVANVASAPARVAQADNSEAAPSIEGAGPVPPAGA